MTQTELAGFRTALEGQYLAVKSLLTRRDPMGSVAAADQMDQIQFTAERDMVIGSLERDSVRLREVRAALGRIHEQTFGICADCEEPISMKRLVAVPWTTTCIECRKAADARPAGYGDVFESPLLKAA